MYRMFIEALYSSGFSESTLECNSPGYEIDELRSLENEKDRPVGTPSRKNFDYRNPFLSEGQYALPPEMIVLPVLAKVDYGFTGSRSGRSILEYSLRASVNDVFLNSGDLGRLIQLEDGNWFILLMRDLWGVTPGILTADSKINRTSLEDRCSLLRERFQRLWRCGLAFFIGSLTQCRDLAAVYELLSSMGRDAKSDGLYYSHRDARDQHKEVRQPEFFVWTRMLCGGDAATLVKEVSRFLIPLNRSPRADFPSLFSFQQDFLQMVYTVLKEKSVSAHNLYSEPEVVDLFDRACRSVDDMVAWASYVIVKASSSIRSVSMAQTIVERVRKFVLNNLHNNLTRKTIAAQLRMNPDYLARIFKKETGISIYEFVQNERILLARSLLERTDTSVCGIATQLGYTNFSHFSETFRRYVGHSPADYRKVSRIVHWDPLLGVTPPDITPSRSPCPYIKKSVFG